MEANLNYKKVIVNAFTMKEADAEMANQANYERFTNATQAWKNAGSPKETSKEFKEFCANYLAEKTKNKQGLACVIVYEPGKADTRERPYELTDVVNELGKRKYKTTYTLVDDETGKILSKTQENKAKAKELAKKLYTEAGFRGSATCSYTKEVVEGEKIAFKIKYQPSKSAQEGTFIYFGIERN